jgi:hypothetical protein
MTNEANENRPPQGIFSFWQAVTQQHQEAPLCLSDVGFASALDVGG